MKLLRLPGQPSSPSCGFAAELSAVRTLRSSAVLLFVFCI